MFGLFYFRINNKLSDFSMLVRPCTCAKPRVAKETYVYSNLAVSTFKNPRLRENLIHVYQDSKTKFSIEMLHNPVIRIRCLLHFISRPTEKRKV